jgi:SAM-dependent methyltransferase
MIDHGRKIAETGSRATLSLLDVTAEPLPHASGSVHLLGMSSVLHVLDEPLPVLAEIRRVLAPGGVFLLHDWVRRPLAAYLAWRRESTGDAEADCLRRGFRLFAAHNKYTSDDWRWLLGEAGFSVRHQAQLRPTHEIFIATPAARPGTSSPA